MENNKKQNYTYKEILLAIREQLLNNERLLKELNGLISIERNAGSYHFDNILKQSSEPYKIRLVIDEVQKRQSRLKELFNKLTDYKFARASINKFQQYVVVENNGEYNFKLVYTDNLAEDYFGKIQIIDEEKFASIINELNSSKLSKITSKGIHVNKNLFFEISDYTGILNGNNSIYYGSGIDCLQVQLTDKDFYEMLNTEINSSLLSNEIIDLINNSSYSETDIEFIESKGVPYNYYRFNELGHKLVLERPLYKTIIKL